MNDNNCRRSCIYPGLLVDIVLKKDQPTGKLTRGVVGRLLTNKSYHPMGIKVMLQDGQVGRVQHIVVANSDTTGAGRTSQSVGPNRIQKEIPVDDLI